MHRKCSNEIRQRNAMPTYWIQAQHAHACEPDTWFESDTTAGIKLNRINKHISKSALTAFSGERGTQYASAQK